MNNQSAKEVNKGNANMEDTKMEKAIEKMTRAELMALVKTLSEKSNEDWVQVGAIFSKEYNGKLVSSVIFDQVPETGVYYSIYNSKNWKLGDKKPRARISIHKDQLAKQIAKRDAKAATVAETASAGSKDTASADI